MYIKNHILDTEPISKRFKRISSNKLFIGKGDLKHTNSKVIITLYVYNVEKFNLTRKLTRAFEEDKFIVSSFLRLFLNSTFIGKFFPECTKDEIMLIKNLGTKLIHNEYYSSIIFNIDEEIKEKEYINKKVGSIDSLKRENNLVGITKSNFKNIYPSLIYKTEDNSSGYLQYIYPYNINDYLKVTREYFLKEFLRLFYLLYINKAKFEKLFIFKLGDLVKKLYYKKVEFNIVSLKQMHSNSDIFTQAVSLKLRDRNNKLFKV